MTAFVQNVCQNDGRYASNGVAMEIVPPVQYSDRFPSSRTCRSTRWKTSPATDR